MCAGNDSENSSNAITNDSNFSNGVTASSSETTQPTRQYTLVTTSPVIKHKEALKSDSADVEVSMICKICLKCEIDFRLNREPVG